MDPARRRTDRRGDVLEKGDDIMVRPLLDLPDFSNREPRLFSDGGGVLLRDLAQLRHRLARQSLNLQPDLEFSLLRPQLAHLWPGITVDHRAKIKAGGETESVLYAKSAASAPRPKRRFSKKSCLRKRD